MEDDEIEHIAANKSKLIRVTKCGPLLFSGFTQAGVMDDVEVAKIKKCGTDFEQAEALYDLLITKADSYPIVLKVFADTKQSGALKILNNKPAGTGTNNAPPPVGTDPLAANYSYHVLNSTISTPNQLNYKRHARDIIVADEDRFSSRVDNVIKKSGSSSEIFYKELKVFASELKVSGAVLMSVQAQIDRANYNTVVREVLDAWIMKTNPQPTLAELIAVLRDLELNFIAGKILEEFEATE